MTRSALKIALLLLSLTTATQAASRYALERDPRLLIRKYFTTKFLVENQDFEIRYDLYNIGNTPATNVRLVDDTFHPQVFRVTSGELVVEFERIPPHSNVSHVVALRPLRPGFYRFTSAEIRYQNAEKTWTRSSLSSEAGSAHVMTASEYNGKISTRLWKWLACLVLASPFVAIPYLVYRDNSGKRRFVRGGKSKRKYR